MPGYDRELERACVQEREREIVHKSYVEHIGK